MPRARTAVLLAAGALAVHELRYVLFDGGHASEATGRAHEYLPLVMTGVAVALAAVVARFARSLVRASRTGRTGVSRDSSFAVRWTTATAILACAYLGQETVEGLVTGAPDVLSGVLGHGGRTALVVAVVVGALVALLERGAGAAVRAAARRGRAPAPRRRARAGRVRRTAPAPPAAAPLARHLGRRAPPAGAHA